MTQTTNLNLFFWAGKKKKIPFDYLETKTNLA